MKPLIFLLFLSVLSCDRKRREPVKEEIPDLPRDTVQSVRIIDRCNYQYLSTNPKVAKKQLDRIVRELDHLISIYDPIIQQRRAMLNKQARELNKSSK